MDAPKTRRNASFLHNDHLTQHANPTKPAVKATSSHSSPILNFTSNPQMVPEYLEEAMQFMRDQEKQTKRCNNYVPKHKVVNEQSRAKLIDWLSELHQKYKMFPETIFTVVNLVDNYLSKKDTPINELQLVGVSALFIAGKF